MTAIGILTFRFSTDQQPVAVLVAGLQIHDDWQWTCVNQPGMIVINSTLFTHTHQPAIDSIRNIPLFIPLSCVDSVQVIYRPLAEESEQNVWFK